MKISKITKWMSPIPIHHATATKSEWHITESERE